MRDEGGSTAGPGPSAHRRLQSRQDPLERGSCWGVTAMGRDQLLDDFPWFVVSRPRRLTVGDLMAGVVLAALGSALWAVSLKAELRDDQRAAFGTVTLICLGVPLAQWGLASVKTRRPK